MCDPAVWSCWKCWCCENAVTPAAVANTASANAPNTAVTAIPLQYCYWHTADIATDVLLLWNFLLCTTDCEMMRMRWWYIFLLLSHNPLSKTVYSNLSLSISYQSRAASFSMNIMSHALLCLCIHSAGRFICGVYYNVFGVAIRPRLWEVMLFTQWEEEEEDYPMLAVLVNIHTVCACRGTGAYKHITLICGS